MGIETQAIYVGHLDVENLALLLERELGGKALVRAMQKPNYKIVEVTRADKLVVAIHIFLNSWAADDYGDVFNGPSTFATMEYNPQNFDALRAVAVAVGGKVRKTTSEPWIDVALATP